MKNAISCIVVDDETIAREIIVTHLSKIDSINLVASCSNPMEAFDIINDRKVDLVFLDINMPEITGISFARSINKDVKVIFTTAYREYAIEGFELQAVDYLLKPISFERLLKAVNTYFDIYSTSKNKISETNDSVDFMFVRADRKMIKIDFNSIVFIESYSDYIKIQMNDKVITTRETISAIEVKLPTLKFIRIHRSYIISLANLTSFTNEHVVISNKALPISRSYKKEVLSRLEQY